jgi:hypothetical protein
VNPGEIVVIGDPGRIHGRFADHTAVGAVTAKRFDNATDTWTVTTADGQALRARVLIDTAPGADGVVAAHGVPNYFRVPGPHTARQAGYIAGLLDGMQRGGSTRIEARSQVRVRRRLPTRGLSRFYLTGSVGVPDEIYDGPAVLTHNAQEYPVEVRLTGHLDPIDGQYHWQGTLYAELSGNKVTGAQVGIRIGEHSAAARISERTPWGTLAVIGAAGYPPFPLADLEGLAIGVSPRI